MPSIAANGPGGESPPGRIFLVHLITGTSTGGAESMLLKLVSRIDRSRFDITVISLTGIADIGSRIESEGIPVFAVEASGRSLDPLAVVRLARMLRRIRPDVLQTWMYHADLAGSIAAALSGSIPVAWNIRHSDLNPDHMKKRTIRVAKWCARLSRRLPRRIVCCSRSSMKTHAELGYDRTKMTVIPNGFDTSLFKPDTVARKSVREELGVKRDAPLIGLLARYHPQKDHANFLRAAAILSGEMPHVRFVLCGEGVTPENEEIMCLSGKAGIGDKIHLLGRRADMPRIQASLDIASSSAAGGEGFPNIIGEAMSCAVPCVVTDVGDSAEIVGDTGAVVDRGDPAMMAAAWKRLLQLTEDERAALGQRCRDRIKGNYEIGSITARYEVLYLGMVREFRRRQQPHGAPR